MGSDRSDVLVSQCSSGESIDTTSFGQHDRQTYLSRTFRFEHPWSLEDFSCIEKYSEMEETGKKINKITYLQLTKIKMMLRVIMLFYKWTLEHWSLSTIYHNCYNIFSFLHLN